MLDGIVSAAVNSMTQAGITAFSAYPDTAAPGGAFISVCVKSAKSASAGFAEYLGTRTAASGAVSEVYGLRWDIVMGLDVFCPAAQGAEGCAELFDSAAQALGSLSQGIKIKGLVCAAAEFDRKSGRLHASCEIHGTALFTAEGGGDTEEFTDFVLRGVLDT